MMHEKARRRLERNVAEATTSEARDFWLDTILDCELRATEWDARKWGLPYANEPVPGFDDNEPVPDEPRMRPAW